MREIAPGWWKQRNGEPAYVVGVVPEGLRSILARVTWPVVCVSRAGEWEYSFRHGDGAGAWPRFDLVSPWTGPLPWDRPAEPEPMRHAIWVAAGPERHEVAVECPTCGGHGDLVCPYCLGRRTVQAETRPNREGER